MDANDDLNAWSGATVPTPTLSSFPPDEWTGLPAIPANYSRCMVCYGPGHYTTREVTFGPASNRENRRVTWLECDTGDCPGHFVWEDKDVEQELLFEYAEYWCTDNFTAKVAACPDCVRDGVVDRPCVICDGVGRKKTTQWTRCFRCRDHWKLARDCTMCDGLGKLIGRPLSKCTACDVTGRETLETPDGTIERRMCFECSGAGFRQGRWSCCYKCDGIGWYESKSGEDVTCNVCEGSCSREGIWSPCIACDNSGTKIYSFGGDLLYNGGTCNICNGEGSVPGVTTMCYLCRGPGSYKNINGDPVLCPSCNGRGMLDGIYSACFKCETTGFVKDDNGNGILLCPVCTGRGSLRGLWTRCVLCKGKGAYPTVDGGVKGCHACIGNGIRPGAPYCLCDGCRGSNDECGDCAGQGMYYAGKGRYKLHPLDTYDDDDYPFPQPGLRRKF